MKNLIITLFACITSTLSINAQDFAWSAQYGGNGQERIWGIVENSNLDVISTGTFQSSVNFNPSTSGNTFTSNGNTDIAILSLDQNGGFNWVRTFGGSSDDLARAIDIDANGNIYFVANYKNTVDFDPSNSVLNFTSQGNHDIAIVKLNPFGALIWAKSIGGTGAENAQDIEVTPFGEIVITGSYSGTCDFDPSNGTFNKTSAGFNDVFLLKLDNSGNLLWVNTFGSNQSGIEAGYQVEVLPNGNIAFVGSYLGTVDIDPSNSIVSLTSSSGEDAFLCLYTNNGALIYGKTWGGLGEDVAAGLKVGKNGDYYIGGFFRDNTDLDPGPGTQTRTSPASRSCFTLKLDANGNYVWGNITATISAETNFKMQIDKYDNTYATGYFFYPMDFDPGAGSFMIPNAGASDGYVQKLDKDGNFVWAYSIGGSGTDNSSGLLLARNNFLYSVGLFSNTVDFDPSSLTSNMSSTGSYDAYIQKIYDCNESDSVLFVTACNSYTSPSGNYTWNSNGTYYDTLMNNDGCDSLLTINLFITSQNKTVSQNGFTLTSNSTNSTYQWLDCSNSNTAIQGETNRSFTATQNGNYAVELTQNGCKDTSACVMVLGVGLDQEKDQENSFRISPNPSRGNFSITFNNKFSGAMSIYSIRGRLVHHIDLLQANQLAMDLKLKSGLYFVQFQSISGRRNTAKLIIE